MMYRVRWEIDLEAGSARKAALDALAVQRNRQSMATVFDVIPEKGRKTRVDLKPGTGVLTCDYCGCRCHNTGTLKHVYPDIPELLNRIEPGGEVPVGECNECGALVYE